jgi:hypothetical protein
MNTDFRVDNQAGVRTCRPRIVAADKLWSVRLRLGSRMNHVVSQGNSSIPSLFNVQYRFIS